MKLQPLESSEMLIQVALDVNSLSAVVNDPVLIVADIDFLVL